MKKNYLNFKKASLALSFVALFGATGVKAQVLVAGSATGTTPVIYTSLSSAFAAINTGTHTGAITISVTANVTEPTPPTALLASGGTSTYTSVYIRPAGGSFTISSVATPTANRGIIELTGADNVTIDGDDPATAGLQNLSIVSTVTTTPGIANVRLASNSATGADGANNITIKNCIIKGSRDAAGSIITSYGIQFFDASAGAIGTSSIGANSSIATNIQGNTITRCAYGIHAIGNSATYLNSGLSIVSNTLGSSTATDNIGFRGIDISYTEINAATNTASISLNNITFGNASAGNAVMGIEVGSANAGLRIARNNIHDATASPLGAYGIGLNDATGNSAGVIIRNNFIRDIKGAATATTSGAQASGIGGIGIMVTGTVTGLMINNNTIAQMAAGALGSCVQFSTAATIAQFRNNALVNTISNSVATCFYSASTLNIAGGTLNNNDYFNNTTARSAFYNNAYLATFATFTAATAMDANSYSVLPIFASATDLHLVAGQYSLLESTGASTAVTGVAIDIDGDNRPGPTGSIYGGALNPDIGADEFDGLIANCITPTITAVASPTGIVCAASSVTLTANGAGTAGTYTWSQGSPSNTLAVSPTVVVNPTVATTYYVLGTTSLACTSIGTISIAVDNTPTLTAVASATAICLNRTVSITAGGATSYTLTSPTGTIGNGAALTPTATTAYTVIGSNACATPSTVVTITVNSLPTLTISSSSASICSGGTVILSVNGSGTSYTWAVNSSTNTAITATPAAAGGTLTSTVMGYSVTAMSVAGCTASSVSNVTVITTPVIPPLASPPQICVGGTAALIISGATTYTWLPMNVNTQSLVITPTVANTATITPIVYTVTSANGACSSTKTTTLTVNPLPVLFAQLNNVTAVCAGTTASLTAGGALNFTWMPATTPSVGANVTINPTITTTYTYTGFNGTCTSVSTLTVPVNPLPTLSITATPTALCTGSVGNLTGAGGINYTWSASGNNVSYASSFNINPTQITAYTLVGDNQFGCTNSASYIMFVNSLPTVNIAPSNTLVCLGRTLNLVATTNNATIFQWTLPGGGNANGTSTQVSPSVTSIYTLQVTNPVTQCNFVKTATISVFNPSFTIPTNTAICKNTTLTLGATGAASYTWNPGNYQGPNVPFSPSVSTIYTVVGTGTIFNVFTNSILNCQATYTLKIDVNPNPTVTAMASQSVICREETAVLTASGATTYSWRPGVSATTSVVTVFSTDFPNYVNAITYTVTGYDVHNCKATTTLEVITSGCVGIKEQEGINTSILIYPNPNNGEFTVKSDQDITLSIMNELGQQIRTVSLTEANGRNTMVSDMANGIYFIVGSNQNGRISQKVIISK